MFFFEQFTACLASKLFNSYPQICSFNQGVTPPTKNRTQKHTIHLFKCTLLLQVEGSSLIYRNTKDVETIVFTWNCFVFFLCGPISVLSSFLWLHLLLSLLSLPWMGKLNIIKVPCQCSSLCWVIIPNLQALSMDLNIQMVGIPPHTHAHQI